MDEYTIYCTPEQVKKALEFGAQIKYANAYNAYLPHTMIDFVGESGKMECADFVIPTAEQMIGWLEEQISYIDVIKQENNTWLYIVYPYNNSNKNITVKGFSSRPEATIAAIDEALNYLKNLKQK